MIRNFFKKRKERKEQEYKKNLLAHEQRNKLRQKMFKILEDERLYDTAYVIYPSEFPNLNYGEIFRFVRYVCTEGNLSYGERLYYDGPNEFVFYIYVRKREEPKYNVGDVAHCKVGPYRIDADVLVSGRRYDGKGHYVYLIPSDTGMEWRYLDD